MLLKLVLALIALAFVAAVVDRFRQGATSNATPTSASKPAVHPGSIVTITPGHRRVCMDTRAGHDEISKWAAYGDKEEIVRAFLKHGGEILPEGAQLKVLDLGVLTARVRVLESGRECFVVAELVR